MAFGAPVLGDAVAASLYEHIEEKFKKRPHPYPERPENFLKFRNVMINYQAQLRLLVGEIADRKASPRFTINDATSRDISEVLDTSCQLVKSQIRGIEKTSARLAIAIQSQTGKNYNVFHEWACEHAERLFAISSLSKNKVSPNALRIISYLDRLFTYRISVNPAITPMKTRSKAFLRCSALTCSRRSNQTKNRSLGCMFLSFLS